MPFFVLGSPVAALRDKVGGAQLVLLAITEVLVRVF